MKDENPIDSETLIGEIVRYLAAVDAFRAADCEPSWRPELVSDVTIVSHASGLVAQSQRDL